MIRYHELIIIFNLTLLALFHFQHIEYLAALIVVPLMVLLYFFVLRWKKRTLLKIGDPALVNQLIRDYSPAKFAMKFLLFTVAFTIGIIALANPRIPLGSTTVNRTGIDVMIALDVSKSMLAQDVKPDRLERAKQVLSKLIDRLQEDRIGIVVFAGRAYLQMPLTTDHAAAKMYLASTTPDVVPAQGTVIGDALKMSNAAFNTKEKYKTIILISDGEDHDENAVKLSRALAEEGVMINTIGIGSPEGALIMEPETNQIKRDATGKPVVTKLNEAGLKNIALNGNGIYQLYTNTDDVVSQLEKKLKSMGQKPVKENSLVNFQSFYPVLLVIVLLILLAEVFIPETRVFKTNQIPLVKNKLNPLYFLLFLLVPVSTSAQKEAELIKQGNKAYNEKDYESAHLNYKKAVDKNPLNEKAQFNMGNALYRKKKPGDALLAYDAAIQNSKLPEEKATAFYNKGVVLQQDKKMPECIEEYKNPSPQSFG
ncbi:MAG: VWA domain-containing protein [Ferruginibacter sp.]